MKQVKEYGSWKSPITAEKVASERVGLAEIKHEDESLYWLETRPGEGGRNVIVKLAKGGEPIDLTPNGFNVRNRVHEYGGGSYEVNEGIIYFSNFDDQRIYRMAEGKEPRPISPEGNFRYADYVLDEQRDRLLGVCEDHTGDGEAENYLVAVSLDDRGHQEVLTGGHDFYASPRINREGNKICWVTWDHPNMPWDGTCLHVGELNEKGSLKDERVIAGGESESVIIPKWSKSGGLFYVSDRTGWWNLYNWNGEEGKRIIEREAEFGRPHWQFGISTYDFPAPGKLVYTYSENGRWFSGEKNLENGSSKTYDLPYTQISSLKADGNEVWFIGGSPDTPPGIRELSRDTGRVETLKLSFSSEVDKEYFSVPETIEFESGGKGVHAFYYSPNNKEYRGPETEKPPLLVVSHGGPTASTSDGLSQEIQYWTSRGIAVLDVNYRGSTGFGRDYREELKGKWGVVDVEDCARGALHLAEIGKVDRDRLAVRGGSAGGYTTLASLAFKDVFRAGASYYGVSDPVKLSEDTHKFESRYLDGLIGPYPEAEDVYEERSPIKHSEDITSPVIFFQGGEDEVVPPDQAKAMYKSLAGRNVPTAYLLFEDEQHGFRKEKNIERALEAELFFYSRILNFHPPEEIEEVEIKNLEK